MAEPEIAPVVASPPAGNPEPAAPQPPAPAPSEAAAAPEAKPAEIAEPKLEPTLLEKAATEEKAAEVKEAEKPAEPKVEAKPGEKPTEVKKDEKPEVKGTEKPAEEKVEAKPAEPAKPEPINYEYKLPDTLKLDDSAKTEFHAALDQFRADPAKGAQPLIDLHNKALQQYAEQTTKNQFDVFNKTKANWELDWKGDNEIGGAGYETSLRAIARARDAVISSAKPGTPRYEAERKEFDQFLAVTGAGSHPVLGRILHNAARFIDEPQASQSPLTDLRPPKNNGRAPGSRLYDHPTSQKMSRS